MRLLALVVAAAVVGLTVHALGRRPRTAVEGRALEVATAVAALPLVTTYVLPGHLATELVPLAVLAWLAAARRMLWPALAAVAGWLLTGPVYLAFTNAVDLAHVTALDRAWSQSALAGVICIWLAAVVALRAARPAGTRPPEPGRPPGTGPEDGEGARGFRLVRVVQDEAQEVPAEIPEPGQGAGQQQPPHAAYNGRPILNRCPTTT